MSNLQQVWVSRIKYEEEQHREWRRKCKEEIAPQLNCEFSEDGNYVPIYWQVRNVEHVGVYSNQPVPVAKPRNEGSSSPISQAAQFAADLLQSGLSYCTDLQSFDDNVHRAVDDFLGFGLGVLRVKVESVIHTESTIVPIWGRDPMGNPVQVGQRENVEESIGDQSVDWEFVPYDRFGWEPCNNWRHCSWIFFVHPMTQSQIYKRFGKHVSGGKRDTDTAGDGEWQKKTINIYEVWDKSARKVLFIAKGEDEPLEVNDDPLGLIGFFPTPPPMMTNIASDELKPTPDYEFIKEYVREINRLQERRRNLIDQIRACGFYDEAFGDELQALLNSDDSQYTPIKNLMARMEAVGGDPIIHKDLKPYVEALQQVSIQIQEQKAAIDEILGISDIVRGVTKASESATAQDIKGRWVGIRLTRKREIVQATVRQMMRIMAQLLVSHITPENLQRMTQMQIPENIMQVLSDDTLMNYMVDIETDSTIAKDENAEREARADMLNSFAMFAQSAMPMVQQNALPAGVAAAILTASLAPYARYDRTLANALKTLPTDQQQLQQLSQQMQQFQQQNMQLQQQVQMWQQEAQRLQNKATEATAAKALADARNKDADTSIKQVEIADKAMQPAHTAAETEEVKARTMHYRSMANSENRGRNSQN